MAEAQGARRSIGCGGWLAWATDWTRWEPQQEELKSRSGESKSSAMSSDGSLAENGAVAEEKPAPQMNGSAGDTRAPSHSESALNNDSKTCNTNPHLNALSTDSGCRRADALEAAVLKKEE